ncbi:Acyl-transf-3 domain-containing protein [Aphelenchoides besseyi]|nr:Acyl-transf-3 domain-containing protein [Aphelenchoides besseyi]
MKDSKAIAVPQQQRHARRIDEIQGLRGVAIVFVLLFHLWGRTVTSGFLGVDIEEFIKGLDFFVISGFLMCMLMSKKLPLDREKVLDFYFRRLKRIVPIYLFVILTVLVLSALWFVYPLDFGDLIEETMKPLVFMSNIASDEDADYFIQSLEDYKFFMHMWSLSGRIKTVIGLISFEASKGRFFFGLDLDIAVEIQFYTCVPTLIFLTGRFRVPIRLAIVSLMAIVSFALQFYSKSNDQHMSLSNRFWQFMCGFIAFYVQEITACKTRDEDKSSRRGILVSLIATLILIAFLSISITSNKQFDRLLLLFVTTFLVSQPSVNPILSSPILSYIGDISYSTYLIHWPFIAWYKYWNAAVYMNDDTELEIKEGVALFLILLIFGMIIEETYKRIEPQITNWKTLLSVIGWLYILIGASLFYLNLNSIKSNFQLNGNTVIKNPDQLAKDAIRIWENPQSQLNTREVVNYNDKFQYLSWNLLTCHKPGKENLPTTNNLTNINILWTCVDEKKNGKEEIVVVGNSHARSYYFGIEHHFKDVYKRLSLISTGCPLLRLIERKGPPRQMTKEKYEECRLYGDSIIPTLRQWKSSIDVIIVAMTYPDESDPPLHGNLTEDSYFQELSSFYGELSEIAQKLVIVPQIHFKTGGQSSTKRFLLFIGVSPHLQILNRNLLYGQNLNIFRTTMTKQLKRLPRTRKRIDALKCSKCRLFDFNDVWCRQSDEVCDTIDFRSHVSYFFDSHHVNALGSLKVGYEMRKFYDEHIKS